MPLLSPFQKEDAMDWRYETIEQFGRDTPLGRAILSAFDEVFKSPKGQQTSIDMLTFAERLGDVLADEHFE